MTEIDYIYKYNFIFRIYMLIIFFFNLLIFYFFSIKKNINFSLENKDLDFKNTLIFKKIFSIINNPIIFEYQLNQIQQINSNSKKFIECKKFINYVKNNDFPKSNKYYKKINKLLSSNYKNNSEKITILTKLICINFNSINFLLN